LCSLATAEGKRTPPTTRTLDYLQVPDAIGSNTRNSTSGSSAAARARTHVEVLPNSPPQPSVSEQAEDIEKIEKLVLALAPHQPAHGQA
jgi:hypothetical protein